MPAELRYLARYLEETRREEAATTGNALVTLINCPFKNCHLAFVSERDLHTHKIEEEDHYYCKSHRLDFDSSKALADHKMNSPDDIYCQICDKDFECNDDFKEHVQAEHRPLQRITCPEAECGRKFDHVGAFVTHLYSRKCSSIPGIEFDIQMKRHSLADQLKSSSYERDFNTHLKMQQIKDECRWRKENVPDHVFEYEFSKYYLQDGKLPPDEDWNAVTLKSGPQPKSSKSGSKSKSRRHEESPLDKFIAEHERLRNSPTPDETEVASEGALILEVNNVPYENPVWQCSVRDWLTEHKFPVTASKEADNKQFPVTANKEADKKQSSTSSGKPQDSTNDALKNSKPPAQESVSQKDKQGAQKKANNKTRKGKKQYQKLDWSDKPVVQQQPNCPSSRCNDAWGQNNISATGNDASGAWDPADVWGAGPAPVDESAKDFIEASWDGADHSDKNWHMVPINPRGVSAIDIDNVPSWDPWHPEFTGAVHWNSKTLDFSCAITGCLFKCKTREQLKIHLQSDDSHYNEFRSTHCQWCHAKPRSVTALLQHYVTERSKCNLRRSKEFDRIIRRWSAGFCEVVSNGDHILPDDDLSTSAGKFEAWTRPEVYFSTQRPVKYF